ncbi:MAG: tail fiber domain-containing protein [Planctomycetota bacterium]|jgi:hypothetical protein
MTSIRTRRTWLHAAALGSIAAALAVLAVSCDYDELDGIPPGFADGVDNQVYFEGSGGDYGAADFAARSDHTHVVAGGATDVAATAAELNVLDGLAASTAELNLLAGASGAVWTSDNDGDGSGLDADLLDGSNADAFAASSHDHFGETWSGSSADGLHVVNTSTADSALGVTGRVTSDGNFGCGVIGAAMASTGVSYGVYGSSQSDIGRGVYGWVNSATGATIGVGGVSDSTSGCGVYGSTTTLTGTTYAFYGDCGSPDGFDFYAGGLGTNYGAASSIRWKRDVTPIGHALDMVMEMRGVYYTWDEDHGGQHDMGMIAEEVGEVLPEIVQYEENGTDAIGMDYSKLTPVLVEAVKELKSGNDALRAELAELRATVQALADGGRYGSSARPSVQPRHLSKRAPIDRHSRCAGDAATPREGGAGAPVCAMCVTCACWSAQVATDVTVDGDRPVAPGGRPRPGAARALTPTGSGASLLPRGRCRSQVSPARPPPGPAGGPEKEGR